jgi:hypothetical protein
MRRSKLQILVNWMQRHGWEVERAFLTYHDVAYVQTHTCFTHELMDANEKYFLFSRLVRLDADWEWDFEKMTHERLGHVMEEV